MLAVGVAVAVVVVLVFDGSGFEDNMVVSFAVRVINVSESRVLVRCVHLTVIAQRISTPPIDYSHILVHGYEMAIV